LEQPGADCGLCLHDVLERRDLGFQRHDFARRLTIFRSLDDMWGTFHLDTDTMSKHRSHGFEKLIFVMTMAVAAAIG
jgi:hypothetical protein